jgi:hypothetical protein
MPLATKNNAIIVKDGLLAENCGCCGGWYCYDGAAAGKCFCVCEDPLKALPNVLLFSCVVQSWNPPTQLSGWPNPDTGGNISLNRQSILATCDRVWSGSYASTGKTINVTVRAAGIETDSTSYGYGLNLDWQGPFTSSNGLEYLQPYASTFLTPGGQFSAAAGKSAFKALCDGVSMSTGDQNYPATIVRGD